MPCLRLNLLTFAESWWLERPMDGSFAWALVSTLIKLSSACPSTVLEWHGWKSSGTLTPLVTQTTVASSLINWGTYSVPFLQSWGLSSLSLAPECVLLAWSLWPWAMVNITRWSNPTSSALTGWPWFAPPPTTPRPSSVYWMITRISSSTDYSFASFCVHFPWVVIHCHSDGTYDSHKTDWCICSPCVTALCVHF